MISGVSYVVPDTLYDNVIALHDFIYGPIVDQTLNQPPLAENEDSIEVSPDENITNPGSSTSNRVSSDLTSQSDSNSNNSVSNSTNSVSSNSGYISYVPSARVKKISDAIKNYASSGYSSNWSEDSSYDNWTSDEDTVDEPDIYEPEVYEPETPVYEEEETYDEADDEMITQDGDST